MTSVSSTLAAPIEIWPALASLRRRIAAAERFFLFLDFDGTLAPIVPTPSKAQMPRGLASILGTLCARRDVVAAAVISGRALGDVAARVGLPVIYAGNHGLEIRGLGLEYAAQVPPQALLQLFDCCELLRARLDRFPGAWIEHKQRTATLHVRHVARFRLPELEDLLGTAMANYPELHLRGGKEIFEICPDIPWNKGHAVRWILRQMRGREEDAICLGDDISDEDMFRELSRGITIRVGATADSAARYWMAETDVLQFFSVLAETAQRVR
ncbi:MAG TPA: trehalose-phosphatase [Bryobacteraceae bacterium]|nr:trehalose-phosphatase [Bryobacteraceae bacterium]